MNVRLLILTLVFVTVAGTSLSAQGTKKRAAKRTISKERAERERGRLPKPLHEIYGNILDLEKSGHLGIESVSLKTIDNGKSEAVIWRIRTKRPVSCRHIIRLINEIRDVRFYTTINKSMFERMSTLLNYSERVKEGAIDGRILRRGDVFDLWVELKEVDQRKLTGQDVDTVVFREWKRGRVGR